MSFRRYNIQSLIQSGQRIIPWKVEILYRYISDIKEEDQAYVNIYGSMYEANPVTLCQTDKLYIPTEIEGGMTKFVTEIITLNDKIEYGIYFDLYNSEYVEVKRISVLYRQGSVGSGHNANIEDDIVLLSFVINDGSHETTSFNLLLNNTCSKVPTHYRYASTEAGLSTASWITYSSSIIIRGSRFLNNIYFQVKDATSESNIKFNYIVIEYPTDKNPPTNGNLMYLTDYITPSNEKTNGNLMYLTDFIEEYYE
jgi:hypothetical protein